MGKKEKDESEILGDTAEEELLNWESDVLMGKHVKKQINFIGEVFISYNIYYLLKINCLKLEMACFRTKLPLFVKSAIELIETIK